MAAKMVRSYHNVSYKIDSFINNRIFIHSLEVIMLWKGVDYRLSWDKQNLLWKGLIQLCRHRISHIINKQTHLHNISSESNLLTHLNIIISLLMTLNLCDSSFLLQNFSYIYLECYIIICVCLLINQKFIYFAIYIHKQHLFHIW